MQVQWGAIAPGGPIQGVRISRGALFRGREYAPWLYSGGLSWPFEAVLGHLGVLGPSGGHLGGFLGAG